MFCVQAYHVFDSMQQIAAAFSCSLVMESNIVMAARTNLNSNVNNYVPASEYMCGLSSKTTNIFTNHNTSQFLRNHGFSYC
jgi:hypothetical protein